ncbi:N-acetyltransferase [Enterococcus hirae]|nr:N-acetyltransferase [Enterococcus hirae]
MENKFFTGSRVSDENNLLEKHVSNYSKYIYDQHFIWLKQEPTVNELNNVINKFMTEWMNDSPIFKFDFKPSDEFLSNLENEGFSIEKMLIYTIQGCKLRDKIKTKFEISRVDKDILDKFLEVKFTQDVIYGEKFANVNREFLLDLFREEKLDIFTASLNQRVVGFVNIIKHPCNIEIYDIYTLPQFRNRYVATALQRYVSNFYKDTTIVVIAENSDTPKEMYMKLGYEISGSFYQAQK